MLFKLKGGQYQILLIPCQNKEAGKGQSKGRTPASAGVRIMTTLELFIWLFYCFCGASASLAPLSECLPDMAGTHLKIVVGKQSPSGWTGPKYPNATSGKSDPG